MAAADYIENMRIESLLKKQPLCPDSQAVAACERRFTCVLLAVCGVHLASAGCMKSLYNSWLEPTAVGDFSREVAREVWLDVVPREKVMPLPETVIVAVIVARSDAIMVVLHG